jgi:hypothetical protein
MTDNEKIDNIIREMTLEEKAAMIRGKDLWNTEAVERLGVPSIRMTSTIRWKPLAFQHNAPLLVRGTISLPGKWGKRLARNARRLGFTLF